MFELRNSRRLGRGGMWLLSGTIFVSISLGMLLSAVPNAKWIHIAVLGAAILSLIVGTVQKGLRDWEVTKRE